MPTSAESPIPQRELPKLALPRERQRSLGLVVSVAIHALIIALLWTRRDLLIPTPRPGDPGLGASGGGGGGGGGGGVERTTYIISLPPPSPPIAAVVVVPPVVPPVKVDVPVAKPNPVPIAVDTTPTRAAIADPGAGVSPGKGDGPGSGGGSGGGAGGGTGSGTGPGSGPGSGGEGGGIRPPELRGLTLPFGTPPKELRGKTITFTVSVLADGRVERFETSPDIADRKYYQKISEVVLSYRFRPARNAAGEAVPAVAQMTFELPLH